MAKEAAKARNGKTKDRVRRITSGERDRPVDERIRVRAYELYLARDNRPGDEVDDWLRAERELTARAS